MISFRKQDRRGDPNIAMYKQYSDVRIAGAILRLPWRSLDGDPDFIQEVMQEHQFFFAQHICHPILHQFWTSQSLLTKIEGARP
jgi:hypothetical protein